MFQFKPDPLFSLNWAGTGVESCSWWWRRLKTASEVPQLKSRVPRARILANETHKDRIELKREISRWMSKHLFDFLVHLIANWMNEGLMKKGIVFQSPLMTSLLTSDQCYKHGTIVVIVPQITSNWMLIKQQWHQHSILQFALKPLLLFRRLLQNDRMEFFEPDVEEKKWKLQKKS